MIKFLLGHFTIIKMLKSPIFLPWGPFLLLDIYMNLGTCVLVLVRVLDTYKKNFHTNPVWVRGSKIDDFWMV
jgi:hypothetical protein